MGGESCSLLLSKFFKTQEAQNGSKTGSGALGIPGAGHRTGLQAVCALPLIPCPSPSSQKERANYRETVMKLDIPPPHKHNPRRPEKGLPNGKASRELSPTQGLAKQAALSKGKGWTDPPCSFSLPLSLLSHPEGTL